jgi:hypothetical protein
MSADIEAARAARHRAPDPVLSMMAIGSHRD